MLRRPWSVRLYCYPNLCYIKQNRELSTSPIHYNDLVNLVPPHWWNSPDKTFSTVLGVIIFVTGNAGKFDEDRQILAQGRIDIGSRVLDWFSVRQSADELALVPEIQGTTQEIAVEKCRCAAELVSFPVLSRIFRTVS